MSESKHPIAILFLCTGNSCRSQMAEGFARRKARQYSDSAFQIESAGIEAHGKNPRAIAVMQEAGVDISNQQSTRLNDAMLAQSHWLVTVCGHAKDHCPVVPRDKHTVHWPLTDPAQAVGDEEQIMAVFRDVRDEIEQRVEQLFETILEK